MLCSWYKNVTADASYTMKAMSVSMLKLHTKMCPGLIVVQQVDAARPVSRPVTGGPRAKKRTQAPHRPSLPSKRPFNVRGQPLPPGDPRRFRPGSASGPAGVAPAPFSYEVPLLPVADRPSDVFGPGIAAAGSQILSDLADVEEPTSSIVDNLFFN